MLSQPACAEVSTSIEELTGKKYISSDQHKLSNNFFKEKNVFFSHNCPLYPVFIRGAVPINS